MNTKTNRKQKKIQKLRTVQIAYWVFCALKYNRKFKILVWGEIYTIWFPNRIQVPITFGFGKSCEYKYEYVRF